MNINIGCGNLKKEGYMGIDIKPTKAAMIVADFNTIKLNKVNNIYGRMSLHHFSNPLSILSKCRRISKGTIRFESEPVRGILIPERIAYYFSGDSKMRNHPEEKAPTMANWSRWFSKAKLKMRISPVQQGRVFSKLQNRFINFMLTFYAFYLGNPFKPLSFWSMDMEAIR